MDNYDHETLCDDTIKDMQETSTDARTHKPLMTNKTIKGRKITEDIVVPSG